MKKIITGLFTFIVCLIFPQLLFAQTSNLITQLKVIDNDTTFRFLYYYDSNNNKVLETKYYLNENLWVKMTQTEWLYNNNKCEIQRDRVFLSNNWVTVYEINYIYEDEKLISESHFKFVNGMSEQYKLMLYIYEGSKLKTKKEFYQINGQLILKQITENSYENDLLDSVTIKKISSIPAEAAEYNFSFEYNTLGQLKTETMKEKSPDNTWKNVEKVNWYFNSSGKISSQRTKSWNSFINVWENYTMINYEYNDNKQIVSEIYYKWSSMFWERTIQYLNNYNSTGSLLSTTSMLPIYRKWRTVSSINYSDFINDKANKMETVLSFWGGNSGDKISANIPFRFNNDMEIKKGNQITISYEKIDNTDISTFSVLKDFNIKVYPNPSEDFFYFNTEDYKVTSWSVSDLKGQIIVENNNNVRSGIIDLTNAMKGIYILKVMMNEKVLTQKIIKK